MIVYAHHGVAIDWNWSNELTAWSTTGARDGWAESPIARHQLDHSPRSELAAAAAAGRWWSDRSDSRPAAVEDEASARNR